jgi:hypothetical protein
LQQQFSINDLISLTLCQQKLEDCYYRTCSNCKNANVSKLLKSHRQIDFQDKTTWSSWKKINNRYELVHANGSFEILLQEIDNLWSNFITHHFYTHKQREYIVLLKDESRFNTYIVIQLDFAQNFAFVIQQEVQCAFYYRQQATLFTVYIKVGDEHRNMVIISDSLTHDNKFVHAAQRIVIEFIKTEYPNVSTINYISDGAVSHFKSELLAFLT